MKQPQEFDQVTQAWREAGTRLRVSVTAPFAFEDGASQAIAYLPNFGGPNGMVIGLIGAPDYEPDRALSDAADQAGIYFSFISAEIYGGYDAERFKETLSDWGYFGESSKRPEWLEKQGRKPSREGQQRKRRSGCP
ncbi:MAG: hypothetical protein HY302_14925 [Opitutae bacterium]|nr:hypothetical protein [Opitutae bacterium]